MPNPAPGTNAYRRRVREATLPRAGEKRSSRSYQIRRARAGRTSVITPAELEQLDRGNARARARRYAARPAHLRQKPFWPGDETTEFWERYRELAS